MSIGSTRLPILPSDSPQIRAIKQKAAELIDLCYENKPSREANPEVERLWKFAEFLFEDGAMWAQKAAAHGKIGATGAI
jgi:hypothetical protein